jgi:hypothetical protein
MLERVRGVVLLVSVLVLVVQGQVVISWPMDEGL